MMYGLEKSDSAVVAVKPANKAGLPAAEWVEPRAETEGNADQPHTRRTQSRGSVSPGLERVRQAARKRKRQAFTALLHHVDLALLGKAYAAIRRSQRSRLNWARMTLIANRWLPNPRVMHPFPQLRFAATTQGRSPVR